HGPSCVSCSGPPSRRGRSCGPGARPPPSPRSPAQTAPEARAREDSSGKRIPSVRHTAADPPDWAGGLSRFCVLAVAVGAFKALDLRAKTLVLVAQFIEVRGRLRRCRVVGAWTPRHEPHHGAHADRTSERTQGNEWAGQGEDWAGHAYLLRRVTMQHSS